MVFGWFGGVNFLSQCLFNDCVRNDSPDGAEMLLIRGIPRGTRGTRGIRGIPRGAPRGTPRGTRGTRGTPRGAPRDTPRGTRGTRGTPRGTLDIFKRSLAEQPLLNRSNAIPNASVIWELLLEIREHIFRTLYGNFYK